MQSLVIATMISVLLFRYLNSIGVLPGLFNYVPELLALLAAGLIVLAGMQTRFQYVRPVYWLVFGALVFVLVGGVVVNQVEPGPLFAGLRHYLRAIPFFFLPAVLALKDRQLKFQLLLLLGACLIQLPLAWEQRMETTARGSTSGDYTFGTLMNAKFLTLMMIGAASVLTAFFLRKWMRARLYIPLLLLLLFPTMLTESKGALIILPIVLMTTFLVGSRPGERLRNTVVSFALIAVFVVTFIPVYDHFMKPRWGYGIVDFFLMEGRVAGYLDRNSEIGDPDASPGKWGSLRLAVSELQRDVPTLFFGVGIGNASDSALGPQFYGEHFQLYEPFLRTSLVQLLIEWGFGGVALIFLLFWLLFRDSVAVARFDDGIIGTLALGWTGVVVMMFIGLGYHSPTNSYALSMLFWFFSGVVAAQRMRMALAAREAVIRRGPAGLKQLPVRAADAAA